MLQIIIINSNFINVRYFPPTPPLISLSISLWLRDLQGGSILSFSRLFYDEHWSKHRVITCLDWSPQVKSPLPLTSHTCQRFFITLHFLSFLHTWHAPRHFFFWYLYYFLSSVFHVSSFCSLCLSLQYPELLVASYNNNEDAPHEPDGVALVWNMKFKKTTPEYIYHCQVNIGPLLQSCNNLVHYTECEQ